MNRRLIINHLPSVPALFPPGLVVITPHSAAADTLAVRRQTLYDLARDVLGKTGFRVASEYESFTCLKRSIGTVDPAADPQALAKRVRKILRTLLGNGVSLADLEEHGSQQAKLVARIAREYEQLLDDQALVDNSAVLWRAALLEPEPQPLLVYGYFRARKEEIAFINAFAGEGSIYNLPCGDDPIFDVNNKSADWLAAIGGWKIVGEEVSRTDAGVRAATRFTDPSGIADIGALSFDNAESEVRSALGKAKNLMISGTAAEDIAIVCRDTESYVPLLSTIAEEYGTAVEIRDKIPLTNTLLGSFVEGLLVANETEFKFEATAGLLMHPFGPGLTAYEWKMARKERMNGPELWATLSRKLSSLSWPAEAAPADWITCLSDTFRVFEVRKKAGSDSREILAHNAFIDALLLLDGGDSAVLSMPEFFDTVRELLATIRIPFQPTRGGIPVHTLDTIQGASYQHLFILGMAEGILPPPVVDNPVIDFFERAKLAPLGIEFESAAEVARWSALSFYFTLMVSRQSVTLSVPMTIGDGHKIVSSYFSRLGVEPKGEDTMEISSRAEHLRLQLRSAVEDDELLNYARKQLKVESVRESVDKADEYDGVIGVATDPLERSWSASQFTVLGQCPYRWFAQKLLGLKSADEADTSLSPAVRGNLYHKTLELAVELSRDAADLRSSVLAVLEECFGVAEADPDVGLPKLDNWPLQREEHLNALRKAVRSPKFIGDGATVAGFEQKFETIWNNLKITGRIDRVDRTPEGLEAIDYKTSSSAPAGIKNQAGKSNVDVQLGVYAQVGLPHLYPGELIKKGLYYSLTKGKVLKSIDLDKMEPLKELVDNIHAHLRTGNFAVDPDVDGNACKYCEFDAMCRKGTRLARKIKS